MKISYVMVRKNRRTTVVTDVKALRSGATGLQGVTIAIPNGSARSVFLRKCVLVVIMKFNNMCALIEIDPNVTRAQNCVST